MIAPFPCLTVVVPVFNEERTVEQLLDRVLGSPWVSQVIAVNDCSTDRSATILEAFASKHLEVTYLCHVANRGKGAALRTGFAAATAPYVVVQDADLEYNPDEYGTLLEPLLDGRADVVFGSRFLSSQERRVLYFRHALGNRFLTLMSNIFTNLNLSDMETCYKVFRRELIQAIVIKEDRFGFEPEITAKIARLGCRIYEVGISYSGRTYEEGKKIGWKDGLRAIFCIVKYSWSA